MNPRIVLTLFLFIVVMFIVIPKIEIVGGAYNEDVRNLMSMESASNVNVNPDASSLETFVRMTPNGSKALVRETNNFLNGMFTFFAIVLLIGVVTAGLLFYKQFKEEEERRERFESKFGRSYRGRDYYR